MKLTQAQDMNLLESSQKGILIDSHLDKNGTIWRSPLWVSMSEMQATQAVEPTDENHFSPMRSRLPNAAEA
jgi:hypothetical protein